MNDDANDHDEGKQDHAVPASEISDEALEGAAAIPLRGVPTVFHATYCFGCPG